MIADVALGEIRSTVASPGTKTIWIVVGSNPAEEKVRLTHLAFRCPATQRSLNAATPSTVFTVAVPCNGTSARLLVAVTEIATLESEWYQKKGGREEGGGG